MTEPVNMMQSRLPKLQASSVESYWAFKSLFQEFILDSSASAMQKLNQLYASCDSEVQNLIAHCMALPAHRGLQVALETLDERFGDEYMNQMMERLVRGPTIGENDYQALSRMCAQLTAYITLSENMGKLADINNKPTIRDILLRLDDAMRTRWCARWTGRRAKATQHIKEGDQAGRKQSHTGRKIRYRAPKTIRRGTRGPERRNRAPKGSSQCILCEA